MKYIYITNGRADKVPQYQEFYDQLKETPHPYEVYTTLGEGDATRFVRLYCDLHPEEEVCFVACGGNGIIIEVATGLVGYSEYLASYSQKATAFNSESKKQKSKFTMAILYIGGTTKDFLINFPGRNFFSVKEMLAGTVTPVDIIRVNDSYSLNVCNIGFNSKVASRANELVAKGKTAHEAYTRGVVNAILTSRFNSIKITVDGERITRSHMVLCTLANGRRVGGEFNCAPNAKIDDGLIDVCLFRGMSLLRLLMLIPLYRSGEHIGSRLGKNKIIYRQAREVEVSSKDLIDVYLDGELLTGSRFEVKILPGAVPLRLPPVNCQ
jgi:diacylglycerol kinase (ATP)